MEPVHNHTHSHYSFLTLYQILPIYLIRRNKWFFTCKSNHSESFNFAILCIDLNPWKILSTLFFPHENHGDRYGNGYSKFVRCVGIVIEIFFYIAWRDIFPILIFKCKLCTLYCMYVVYFKRVYNSFLQTHFHTFSGTVIAELQFSSRSLS
jgi:hypothetical protein